MTRALFITTETADCGNHIAAWDAVASSPAKRITFDHAALNNAWTFADEARIENPDVIFYIGAFQGRGNPNLGDFRNLRKVAPLVHLCSDSGDEPWHPVLKHYYRGSCFDLQVGIDGPLEAPVDLAVVTPVDFRAWEGPELDRDIRCGFSGGFAGRGDRWMIIGTLAATKHVTVRLRAHDYPEHVRFMRRCKMTINVSNTGSGVFHHLKGRAVEAGWAKSALIELTESPASHWFPKGSFIPYGGVTDAFKIIENASDEQIDDTAAMLHEFVRRRCHPAVIYGEILDRIKVKNDLVYPVARPAA